MTSIPSLLPTVNVSAMTGLPELPEKHFWRVRTSPGFFNIFPYVELCKKTWYGTKVLDAMWTARDDMTIENEIMYLAARILDEREDRVAHSIAAKKYSGEYPPKTLPLEDK